MALEERTQAVPRMANPYRFGYSSPVELVATAQLHPFGIVAGPPVSGVDSVVEMVDQVKKHSDEQGLTSRFHGQLQRGCFGVVSRCV